MRQTLLNLAENKLLCDDWEYTLTSAQIYAVLSQRLALDTNTTNHLFYSPTPLRALRSTHEQNAKHMRVCWYRIHKEDCGELIHLCLRPSSQEHPALSPIFRSLSFSDIYLPTPLQCLMMSRRFITVTTHHSHLVPYSRMQ